MSQKAMPSISEIVRRFLGSKDSLRFRMSSDAAASFTIKCTYLTLQFFAGVLLARLLGPEDLGLYAFTLAIVGFAAIVAELGFPTFLVRALATHRATHSSDELRSTLLTALLFVPASSIVLCLILMGTTRMGLSISTVGILMVPAIAMNAVLTGAMRGLGHATKSQLADSLFRPALAVSILFFVFLSSAEISTSTALTINILSSALAVVFAGALLWSCWPDKIQLNKNRRFRPVQVGRQSLPFLLLAGSQVVNHHTDIVMLHMLTTEHDVGLYRIATMLADGLSAPLIAIALVTAPILAHSHALKDIRRIQKVLVASHIVAFTAMLLFCIPVILYSNELITLVFGSPYIEASAPTSILAGGRVFYALVCFTGVALSMMDRPRTATCLTLVTVTLNIALNYTLIPAFGINGAALATAASAIGVALISAVYIAYAFSIDVSPFGYRSLVARI